MMFILILQIIYPIQEGNFINLIIDIFFKINFNLDIDLIKSVMMIDHHLDQLDDHQVFEEGIQVKILQVMIIIKKDQNLDLDLLKENVFHHHLVIGVHVHDL